MPLLETLRQADLATLYQINTGWITPWADRLMLIVSAPKFFFWPGLLAVIALLRYGHFRERLLLVLLALAVTLGDGVIDNYGKKIFHRPRPNEALTGVRIVETNGIRWAYPRTDPGGRSFPSGHAFNNVALAMVVCAVYRKRTRWVFLIWLWALLVSYSRVYLGAHYPSDILGSWLIAIGYSWAILAGTAALWRHHASRLYPKLATAHPELLG